MARKKLSMDGNSAAAHVSYAFTEVAAIYPITPSSPMAELTDAWSAGGLKNIFGEKVKVIEMQSEAGAAGAVHGSLAAGALTTTYTASQGLLLMIPNMYKIAGELLPNVIHVSARCVASHALNIFGDHSDVYACRQTGYAMLAESNPQEIMDLGAVAHLAAIKGRVPFLNFFDGFRTSHEIQKIEVWDYDELKGMIDQDAVASFRARALNPEHPVLRGSAENGDIFFQHREACNKYYEALPAIVEEYMGKVNEKLGTDYQLFNYYGAPDADRVIIAMGSICDVAEEVIDYMCAAGEKVGLIKVRLFRPFCADKLIEAIPATAKKIAVLDRTKEPGAQGEPLYLDVVTALATHGISDVKVVGGRYGLGSKDTPPSSVFAVYENLKSDAPKNSFTIGIVDDVTGLSLEEKPAPDTAPKGTISCKFWGLGGDGTVGANKNSIKIIGDHTDKFIQAYFQYDSKKTGGITISHLRFGDKPIKSPYYITKADFVACHVPSYILKGYRIVDAIVKIDVPEAWKTIGGDAQPEQVTGDRPELVKFVKDVVIPVTKMHGDSLPVSAFEDYVDGTFPQGAAAYEKRGVAVDVPEWIPENCIQCNQCSYVCPHATIRPFALNAEEVAAAPEGMKMKKMTGKGCENYQFAVTVSPLDCMGCGLCVNVCPAKTKALKMVPQESQAAEQDAFDYAVAKVSKKDLPFAEQSIKGSQFNQPLLEFSGSCAGCAETSYARLITQLFGERMYISNATGCSSIWGGSAPSTPYTVNRDTKKGPAWANSLFEDNAEHGLGIYLGQKTIREKLKGKTEALIAIDYAAAELKAAAQAWLDTYNDGKANTAAAEAYIAALEDGIDVDLTGTQWEAEWLANGKVCTCEACSLARDILAEKDYLAKKSVWIFGGDGWAYDIGFGGLDHVIASGEDVNIMVFDTEVYSNTGGQASKASQIGQVAQFAAAGKAIGKKDLAAIAMSYGYVYVAQIAMGADMNQTIKAIAEAEAYPGPSIVIGYAPCEMHSIKGGMTNCQSEMKRAVEAGYWQLFRFNPMLKKEGKNPFSLDSKEPTADYIDFIKGEARYSRLMQQSPERATELFEKAAENAKKKYDLLKKKVEFYEE